MTKIKLFALLFFCWSYANAQLIYGHESQSNVISSFSVTNPSVILEKITVTGISPGYAIAAMDFRPSTGELYVLAASGAYARISSFELYKLNLKNGLATKVGSTVSTATSKWWIGFDFNPVSDKIELVCCTEANRLRMMVIDPINGSVAEQVLSENLQTDYLLDVIHTSGLTSSSLLNTHYLGAQANQQKLNMLSSVTGLINSDGFVSDTIVSCDVFRNEKTNIDKAYLTSYDGLYLIDVLTGVRVKLGQLANRTLYDDIAVLPDKLRIQADSKSGKESVKNRTVN